MCHTGGKSGGRLQKIFLDPPPPELLVRSDVLTGLFPDALTKEDALQSGPDLGNKRWHYRVVDIKFTTPRAERPKSIGSLTLKNTVTWPYSRQTVQMKLADKGVIRPSELLRLETDAQN